MQLNYNSQAADKGVYIVGACGFDSIPADMGVLYTREQFKGVFVSLRLVYFICLFMCSCVTFVCLLLQGHLQLWRAS
jgi:hypothetical protein